MNTVQQPASDVTVTLLAPRDKFQRVSGLQSFSNALVTVLTPGRSLGGAGVRRAGRGDPH